MIRAFSHELIAIVFRCHYATPGRFVLFFAVLSAMPPARQRQRQPVALLRRIIRYAAAPPFAASFRHFRKFVFAFRRFDCFIAALFVA